MNLCLKKRQDDYDGVYSSAAESIALKYPEPDISRYIVQSLFEDDEENPDDPSFSEEHVGAAFLHLKIVLDAFNAT